MASYQYIFTMKGLSKVHPPDKTVLKEIWLAFLPGAKIGVLGANGAGKSTLLRIMAGLDRDFGGEAFAAAGVSIGFLPQEPALDPEVLARTLDVADLVLCRNTRHGGRGIARMGPAAAAVAAGRRG